MPSDWKESIIIKLPKKGDRKKCENWRGISILPAITKIFTQIILERISAPLDKLIRPNQAGFRPGRSCIDNIHTLRILIEQSAEYNSPLYLAFIDFAKAFDSLKRDIIWSALSARGVPDKIINIIKCMYDGSCCRVLHEKQLSESFPTVSGVKQGCALSPLLFITALDIAFETYNRCGINWKMTQKLGDLSYADDVVLISNSYNELQTRLSNTTNDCLKLGLQVNIKKTKSMRINVINNTEFKIDGGQVDDVNKFEYLGSILTPDGGTTADIQRRISIATNTFAGMSRVWSNKALKRDTKIGIFNACVKSVLLYGSETWHMKQDSTRKLQAFVNRCLRRIIGTWWPRTISNPRLWQLTNQKPIEKEIMHRKYKWIGHTLRKQPEEIVYSALQWNPQGTRNRGRPKMTWRRCVNQESKKSFNELKFLASNRNMWKSFVDRLSS